MLISIPISSQLHAKTTDQKTREESRAEREKSRAERDKSRAIERDKARELRRIQSENRKKRAQKLRDKKRAYAEKKRNENNSNSNSNSKPQKNLQITKHQYILKSTQQGEVETHLGKHISQVELENMPLHDAYEMAFEAGDELFEMDYNAIDGVGINVGNGKRFTSVPRIDLTGPKSWASHVPHRKTGPNGTSCIGCHSLPVADGAGGINSNAVRLSGDRTQTGMIERQAPHMFGLAALQLLAEEMTTDLHKIKNKAKKKSCDTKKTVRQPLESKGISFGTVSYTHLTLPTTPYV